MIATADIVALDQTCARKPPSEGCKIVEASQSVCRKGESSNALVVRRSQLVGFSAIIKAAVQRMCMYK